MMTRRYEYKGTDDVELDVTAFMNLMIVLVPVLLLSMTFTKITVMDITLPELTGGSANSAKDQSKLEVEVTTHGFRVFYPTNVLIQEIPLIAAEESKPTGESAGAVEVSQTHDYRRLSVVLREVKSQLPENKDILLLFSADADYQSLVLTMDTIKSYKTVVAANLVEIELFPNVSLGDAEVK